jgi:hypothetical protein
MSTIEEVTFETDVQERSGLATTSLICSLIICCPIATIVGPILGLIALIKMKAKPQISGRGFAWSGIIIGVVSTIVWVGIGAFVTKMGLDFLEKVATLSTETIQAGYEGDYQKFRGNLTRSSSSVTDEEIKSFIDTLQTRYGKFDSSILNMQDQNYSSEASESAEVIPVRFIFETNDASGLLFLEITSGTWFDYEMHISKITIFDSKDGNIEFPNNSEDSSTE